MSQTTNVQNGTVSSEEKFQVLADVVKNLTMDDLVRGSTPAGLEQRCLELCQSYISGSWTNAKTTADLDVRRISGGMTNQLYYVQLKEHVPRVENAIYPDEPNEVAIKLYQEKHMKNYVEEDEDERLNDIIVLTIISEVGIGPQVYGIFNDGVILAYHKHEQFRPKHQQNPKLLRELAHILAQIHHLSVPIRKDNNWLIVELKRMLDLGYSNTDVPRLVEELNLDQFKRRDLAEEFQHFQRYISDLNSPLVFCHNDFRGSNILVTEPNQRILLCDLEYSSYGARGYDIGVFLTEWDRELFQFDNFAMPETCVIENFVQLYLEGCEKIDPGYSEKEGNSLESLVAETKLYILFNFMFFMVFMLKQTESLIPQIPFDEKNKMLYVNKTYKMYHNIKDQLIQEGIIKP